MQDQPPQNSSVYEKILGLLFHGCFKGEYAPVVAEVWQYASQKLEEAKPLKKEEVPNEIAKNA